MNWYETWNFAELEECRSEKAPISTDEIVNWLSILKSAGGGNKHKLNFAHLNINSIRNKSDLLAEQVAGNICYAPICNNCPNL